MDNVTLPYNFTPRDYQLPMWDYFQNGGNGGVCVWHRRSGKDLNGIHMCAAKAMQRVGLYWHLLPTYQQGRKIVWNGMDRDGRPFIDAFPPELIDGVPKQQDMSIRLVNGSIYQVVGTDDVDRLVGTNPVGCIFSEYSLHDPAAWNYIRPILAENGGWALFIYTARGRNHGYRLFEMASKNERWFCQRLTVDDTGVVPQQLIDDERAEGSA